MAVPVKGFAEFASARILVVDDNEANSELIREILGEAGFGDVQTSSDSEAVPRLCRVDPAPDLLILDLHMPGLSGFQIMAELGDILLEPPYVPVLVVTADVTIATRRRALSLGAQDFVNKPIDAIELVLRTRTMVRAHLLQRDLNERVARRTREVELARRETLERLAVAAEYRDDDTRLHTRRVGRTAGAIAGAIGLAPDVVELLMLAAPLHDIGKIGIADAILLKPGRLTDHQSEMMRAHASIGASILSGSASRVLLAAAEIARFHHERWDGKGYLAGLAGEQIPLTARISAVADVFDALTHDRPYKEAWPVEQAVAEIVAQRGQAFDPNIVDSFCCLDHDRLAAGDVSDIAAPTTVRGGSLAAMR